MTADITLSSGGRRYLNNVTDYQIGEQFLRVRTSTEDYFFAIRHVIEIRIVK